MKPVLVIMAAGMGSRYGGLKQIDPIDEQGHIIIDYSIYDAKLAGFEKVVFIIKKENEMEFREVIGDRLSKIMEVDYAYQDGNNLPEGFRVPEGREKPWGTGHAILSCMDSIHGAFAVINADDYYGRSAFQSIYDYLVTNKDDEKYRYAMVGYELSNTVTEHGHVARGVCKVDLKGNLLGIEEKTRIEKHEQGIEYTVNDGESWEYLKDNTIVSMNMWGFTQSILQELEEEFPRFLQENLKVNPLKCEYFLPEVVGNLLMQGKAQVTVLESKDRWYGVTYKEDKAAVMDAVENMKKAGKYPERLWEE